MSQACQDASRRRDPTGTGEIRRAFDKEASRRFQTLGGLIQRVIVQMDVLGLRGQTADNMEFVRLYSFTRDGRFVKDTMGDEARAFMTWLREATAAISEAPWTSIFVDKAYAFGVEKQTKRLTEAGRPPRGEATAFHEVSKHQARSRAHASIKNIVDVMNSQISRIVAQGILDQVTPEKMSEMIIGRVNAIGQTRSRLVAGIETVTPYYAASLNVFEDAGITHVGLIPEWMPGDGKHDHAHDHAMEDAKRKKRKLPPRGKGGRFKAKGRGRWPKAVWVTAGDDKVCPQCEPLEGQVFTIHTASKMLPVHPNCRCDYEPILD